MAEQRPKSTAYEESSPLRDDDFAPKPPPAALALHGQPVSTHHPTLSQLLAHVRSYSEPSAADLAAIERAYHFASEAHAGQTRESGEPYVNHVLSVAIVLAEMRLVDPETLQAALLHDTIEDNPSITRETLAKAFSESVAMLVDGVTKLSTLPKTARLDDPALRETAKQQEQAETLRKMFMAMFEDIRVVLIKLADRLHNMRTLDATTPEKQRRIAAQTLEIYAPLANRLGIWQIKSELEDLSFYYLDPQRYLDLVAQVQERKDSSARYIARIIAALQKALKEAGISCEIKGRAKHIHSLYQKMLRKNRPYDRIYDLLAVRIIVNEIQDCYGALGVIHSLWPPIVGEFDDYIAVPKESMYQSLHTAVWAFDNKPLEIQIRTHKMHETAEFGIAAHWRYKEGQRTARRDREYETKIASLRRQMDWRHDVEDAQEFVESLHSDIFQDYIYVYTPRGDIVELPAGATPIDFAFRIHTELGYQCAGATANGKIINLDTPLKNGDMVRIMKDPRRKGPSRDWIHSGRTYVTTANARQKIGQWFRRQAHDENVAQGREILESELKRMGMHDLHQAEILALFPRYDSWDRLLEAIGNTDISPAAIAAKLTPLRTLAPATRVTFPSVHNLPSLDLGGASNLLSTISRCCRPMPGDEIMGYTTRGRGISVHRADCHNIVNLKEQDRERLVRVSWDGLKGQRYLARVRIEALDRVGLLRDVTTMVADEKVNMGEVQSAANKGGGTQHILANLEVTGVDQLLRLMKRLESISGVYEVRRDVPTEKK
ncbi:MAG TPA: bifunctional (p)ppGpp synthetase/guanosine-3',5'-bis(diphosphate) 3'-pyrophosphohydrolase [Chloroflexia bacterium]|nr:bifunctional (p)ppGpp synthetase/guanosine-3',5'-bis(diphosphate) 3'-pyrophosphohydrolase [Chloroflexia bacterium]